MSPFPSSMACDPFHHQPAVIKQLLGKFFGTLHPVLAVDDDALLEAFLSRVVRDLKRLLIVLGPPRPLWREDIRCISNMPPQSTSTESSSPLPWGTICTAWLSTRAPFPSLLSSPVFPCPLLHLRTRRPRLRSPFLGVAGERGQPQLLLTCAATLFQNGLGHISCCYYCRVCC
ncbi:hypothetical protein V1522DRAFT_434494 [Lipomyces starkeyi]